MSDISFGEFSFSGLSNVNVLLGKNGVGKSHVLRQAQQQLQDLQNKGVQDYLLIRRGGLTNAISLGLFSSLEAVNNRLSEMERKGYTPVVIPRFETRDEHWLRAELGAGFEDYSVVPADVIGEVKIGPIPCTAVAQIKDGD